VGSMRHRRARWSRAFACEGVHGTSARIGDHTVPQSQSLLGRAVRGFFEYRSNKIIRWRLAGCRIRRGGGGSPLRGRLSRVYKREGRFGQAGFFWGGRVIREQRKPPRPTHGCERFCSPGVSGRFHNHVKRPHATVSTPDDIAWLRVGDERTGSMVPETSGADSLPSVPIHVSLKIGAAFVNIAVNEALPGEDSGLRNADNFRFQGRPEFSDVVPALEILPSCSLVRP
jgi:hypothetical protein